MELHNIFLYFWAVCHCSGVSLCHPQLSLLRCVPVPGAGDPQLQLLHKHPPGHCSPPSQSTFPATFPALLSLSQVQGHPLPIPAAFSCPCVQSVWAGGLRLLQQLQGWQGWRAHTHQGTRSSSKASLPFFSPSEGWTQGKKPFVPRTYRDGREENKVSEPNPATKLRVPKRCWWWFWKARLHTEISQYSFPRDNSPHAHTHSTMPIWPNTAHKSQRQDTQGHFYLFQYLFFAILASDNL